MLLSEATSRYNDACAALLVWRQNGGRFPVAVVRYAQATGWSIETVIEKLWDDVFNESIMTRIPA